MRLITGEPAAGTIVGRTGSDNLALSLNGDGTVKAILGAEAKCYDTSTRQRRGRL
ncbi:MAG: hypothetical protein H0V34_06470 [Gammaproteobacteria bacterium]|nr:hypothetical protein [Gammaproteobacteria bacterium]